MLLKKLTGILLLSITGVIYSDLSTAADSVGFFLQCINSIDHTLVYSVPHEKQQDGAVRWQSIEHEIKPGDRKYIDIGMPETTVVIKDKNDNRILLQEKITCVSKGCESSSLLSVNDYVPKIIYLIIPFSKSTKLTIVNLEMVKATHS